MRNLFEELKRKSDGITFIRDYSEFMQGSGYGTGSYAVQPSYAKDDAVATAPEFVYVKREGHNVLIGEVRQSEKMWEQLDMNTRGSVRRFYWEAHHYESCNVTVHMSRRGARYELQHTQD
jgi:hypothetical protein